MTQEQFEQNFEFQPSLGYDQIKEENKVSMILWDNSTGNEVFNLDFPNPPKEMQNPDFYKTKDWEIIKPEVVNLFYKFYLLFFMK